MIYYLQKDFYDPPPDNPHAAAGSIKYETKFSLLHSWSEFYICVNAAVKQFGKRDRHGIGERMEKIAFDFLDYLVLASKKKSDSRMNLLEKMDRELVKEKILVRLSYKIGALPEPRYIDLEKRIIEMGRQVGGWIKGEHKRSENENKKKEEL